MLNCRNPLFDNHKTWVTIQYEKKSSQITQILKACQKLRKSVVIWSNIGLNKFNYFCLQVRIKQEASFYGQISPPMAKNSDAAAAANSGGGSNPIRHQVIK